MLKMPLPSIEEHQTNFGEMLNSILRGDLTSLDLRLELFISLQYGRGRVTLGDYIAVTKNEYSDPLFLDLVRAFEEFAQSEHIKQKARKLPEGSLLLSHLFMVQVQTDVLNWCKENLTAQDTKKLAREAQVSQKTWEEYVKELLMQWMTK